MAKKVIIRSASTNEAHPYTIIETLEDIGQVPCFAPEEDLKNIFNDGHVIIVNRRGGYCLFDEAYHTIEPAADTNAINDTAYEEALQAARKLADTEGVDLTELQYQVGVMYAAAPTSWEDQYAELIFEIRAKRDASNNS